MKNLYRVDIEQRALELSLSGEPIIYKRESFDVLAGTLESAIKRARSAASKNGYLKSCPLEITKAERIATDIL